MQEHNRAWAACVLAALASGCVGPDPRGPVVLAGGGGEGEIGDAAAWSARLYRHFLDGGDITGDGRIVVALLSYRDQSDWLPRYFRSLGADDAINVKIDSTAAADDPTLSQRFEHVDALFIKGGDQGRYYDFWNDRRVERIIRDVHRRGGAVGGTSAGAMALAEFALAGGMSLTSAHVHADARTDMLDDASDGGSGIHRDFLGLVPGVLIDSHFSQRNRFGRMLGACAKAVDDFRLRGIVGIGLDERTGLLIRGMRGACIGAGTVTVLRAGPDARLIRVRGQSPAWSGLRYDQLADGWTIDLASGDVQSPR